MKPRGRTSSGTRLAVQAPNWLHERLPHDPAIVRVRVREGLIHVCERRGHKSLAIGLRLIVDLEGFLVYASNRPGEVTPSAVALWDTHPDAHWDDVLLDLLDTCRRILDPRCADDYWADFLATIRGALVS